MAKRQKIAKPRNAGTMTESAFWGMIRSTLRRRSMYWKPIALARKRAERKYTGPNKRQKFEYLCSKCESWFPGKEIEVDHLIPAGTLTCASDLEGFVSRLFCEVDGLRVLCKECHRKITNENKKIK